MAPRDFSETGAFGAGSGAGAGTDVAAQFGASLPRSMPYAPTPTAPRVNSGGTQDKRADTGFAWNQLGFPSSGPGNPLGGGWLGGRSFAEGGAIPTEEDDAGMGPDNGLMDMISKAQMSVKEVLAYGRRKHGLLPGGEPGGGGDEGAIPGAQAAHMPMIPGTQSESGIKPPRPAPGPGPQAGLTRMPVAPASQSNSGVKPLQPMPGPLPPTSNPFGRRSEAAPDPDEGGAIDTEEEMA